MTTQHLRARLNLLHQTSGVNESLFEILEQLMYNITQLERDVQVLMDQPATVGEDHAEDSIEEFCTNFKIRRY